MDLTYTPISLLSGGEWWAHGHQSYRSRLSKTETSSAGMLGAIDAFLEKVALVMGKMLPYVLTNYVLAFIFF